MLRKTSYLFPALIALAAILVSTATLSQVSLSVRKYRLHMFDPEISVLANRTSELMFDTARVEHGTQVWQLPVQTRPLDFTYVAAGEQIAAEDFAERTFTDALLVIKHGCIVYERYLNRATDNTHFMSYSMSKSFNTIMAGIALAEGKLPSVNVLVTDYMPELRGTAYEGLTLKHLLQMRSGAAWDDNFFVPGPARDAHIMAYVDGEQRFFSAARNIKERSGPPGQLFNYNSIEAALVGEIVSRATGSSPSNYLSEKVWKPAGMENYAFYVLDGPPGVGKEFTAGAFNAVLRDYGRVGLMLLNGGRANGRQILPAAWVKESTTPGPGGSDEVGLGYAYLFWTLNDTAAYTMLGGEGQYVFVDPDSETVIVKLSHVPVGPDGAQASAETLAFLRAASAWDPK